MADFSRNMYSQLTSVTKDTTIQYSAEQYYNSCGNWVSHLFVRINLWLRFAYFILCPFAEHAPHSNCFNKVPLTQVRALHFIIATSPGMSVSFRNVPVTELLACESICVGNETQHIGLGSNNALIIIIIIIIIYREA